MFNVLLLPEHYLRLETRQVTILENVPGPKDKLKKQKGLKNENTTRQPQSNCEAAKLQFDTLGYLFASAVFDCRQLGLAQRRKRFYMAGVLSHLVGEALTAMGRSCKPAQRKARRQSWPLAAVAWCVYLRAQRAFTDLMRKLVLHPGGRAWARER